ncbi:hypothetical protein ACOSQ4_022694 [Xanthoceras sorbifolium]
MKTLFWNVRGLGNDRTFHVLRSLVQEVTPDIVFLSETISDRFHMEYLRVNLGFVGKLVVERRGRSGGLCLFWGPGVDVTLLSYSHYHIDVRVRSMLDKV